MKNRYFTKKTKKIMIEKYKKKGNCQKNKSLKKLRLNGKLNAMKNFKVLETKLKPKWKNFKKGFKNFR